MNELAKILLTAAVSTSGTAGIAWLIAVGSAHRTNINGVLEKLDDCAEKAVSACLAIGIARDRKANEIDTVPSLTAMLARRGLGKAINRVFVTSPRIGRLNELTAGFARTLRFADLSSEDAPNDRAAAEVLSNEIEQAAEALRSAVLAAAHDRWLYRLFHNYQK